MISRNVHIAVQRHAARDLRAVNVGDDALETEPRVLAGGRGREEGKVGVGEAAAVAGDGLMIVRRLCITNACGFRREVEEYSQRNRACDGLC